MLCFLGQWRAKIWIVLESLNNGIGEVDGGGSLKLLFVAGEADVIVSLALIASSVLNEALYDAGAERSRTTVRGSDRVSRRGTC